VDASAMTLTWVDGFVEGDCSASGKRNPEAH